jgi:hypothetical protein
VSSVSVSDDGLDINVRLAPLVDVGNLEFVKVLLWRTGSVVPPKLLATTTVPTTTTTQPRTTTTTAPGSTTTTKGP